jgi:hypothetical protein
MQALDLSALRLATARRPPESVLLLSVAVRLYPFPSHKWLVYETPVP